MSDAYLYGERMGVTLWFRRTFSDTVCSDGGLHRYDPTDQYTQSPVDGERWYCSFCDDHIKRPAHPNEVVVRG